MIFFLIALLVILSGIFWFFYGRHKRRLNRWRQSLELDHHQAVFNNLYARADGFQLSKSARQGKDAIEYVYGEIDFESFIALLSLCKPDSSSIFYDLGSGVGKAVLACAMVFNVQKSCGIELFESLHHCAERQRQHLAALAEYADKAQVIELLQTDFLNVPLSDASLVFVNASAWFGEFWEKTSHHLEQLKPGAIVISTSKALVSNAWQTIHITPVKMSWGIVNAYIQQRLANNMPAT